MDFSKAFDKVNHSKLIWKLHNYGIRSNVLRWIRAFLGDQTQRVVVGGEESDSVPVTSGVPQGSVLGPILFLVYINDLPENVTSHVHLFADDTAMYLTMEGANDSSILQQDLDRLPKSDVSSIKPYPSSVSVQSGLCKTWSEIPKTGFLMTRLLILLSCFHVRKCHFL